MASMFCAISFIKNASNANKYTAGTAVYRARDDEFVKYKFKAFRSEFTPLVEEIWQNTIALIIGRFAFEKDELNVTINQYVPLNISTLGDNPTVYDLPVSPAFGVFTAPIQDPAITENGQADATTRRPIFSVAEEIVPLTKSSFVLCETIKWNYPTSSHNPQTSSVTNPQSNNNKCQRLEDLERIAEKFNSHSPSTHHLYKNPPQPSQREPNLNSTPPNITSEKIRINQLRSSLNNIRGQKDPSNSVVPETLNTEPVIDKGKKPSTFDNNININSNFASSSNTTYPSFDIPTTSPNISDTSDCSQ
ncbi:hypothetical protein C2G38_2226075 [Gigaspora rosea]|uniref:Uncharacterized protein n=1 Tax=Gigaspora rosea TaxID=44941 RepID=A0A397U1Q4_9GLOM|nr:hypothetical protein C2G38_2226075 [Gigaspora rosea]